MDAPRPGGRKRVNSEPEDSSDRNSKRSRILPPPSPPPLFPPPPLITPPDVPRTPTASETHALRYDRFLRVAKPDHSLVQPPYSLARSSSSSITTPGTPRVRSSGMLLRSASFSSFHPLSVAETPVRPSPSPPDGSAKFCLREARLAIDFALPSESATAMPLAYSTQHILYFSRGNRVQYRNMVSADTTGQLFRLQQEKHGEPMILEAGGVDRPGLLALSTSKGIIQVWDADSKKMISTWTTKGAASMTWNGPVISIGNAKGGIRHYDTRIKPTSKMKEQASKLTRHEASIGTLSWNQDGKLLASGDDSGVVHCWDNRTRSPLDVGEFHQRRKKIQHPGSISALAWCPWQSKQLVTGDTSGTVRFWSIDPASTHSNATSPSTYEHGSKIVNLHFASNFKELLTTLGPVPRLADSTDRAIPSWPHPGSTASNALTVHAFPSLRLIASVSASEQDVCGSVLSPLSSTASGAQKIVVAVPGETKLKVFDVWGKRKEIRRQTSSLEPSIR